MSEVLLYCKGVLVQLHFAKHDDLEVKSGFIKINIQNIMTVEVTEKAVLSIFVLRNERNQVKEIVCWTVSLNDYRALSVISDWSIVINGTRSLDDRNNKFYFLSQMVNKTEILGPVTHRDRKKLPRIFFICFWVHQLDYSTVIVVIAFFAKRAELRLEFGLHH